MRVKRPANPDGSAGRDPGQMPAGHAGAASKGGEHRHELNTF